MPWPDLVVSGLSPLVCTALIGIIVSAWKLVRRIDGLAGEIESLRSELEELSDRVDGYNGWPGRRRQAVERSERA